MEAGRDVNVDVVQSPLDRVGSSVLRAAGDPVPASPIAMVPRRREPEQVVGRGTGQVWVESPLQLVSAVEAHHQGLLGSVTRIVPRSRTPLLLETAAALAPLGLPAGLTLRPPRPLPPHAERPTVTAVGDPFSGVVQRSFLLARPQDVVVVDDGLATLHLLELLTSPWHPSLIRARAEHGLLRRVLGSTAATWLRTLARTGRLTVFTAVPVPDDLAALVEGMGARIVRNSFEWLRSRSGAGAPAEPLVVLGSSLVRNGLVHADRYLEWLDGLASTAQVAYFPHRRESLTVLRTLRRDPRIRVYELGVPVEISLRGLEVGHRVISLPSTAVVSLRLLLEGRGVPVEAMAVPPDWWTARASRELRDHLCTVVTPHEAMG